MFGWVVLLDLSTRLDVRGRMHVGHRQRCQARADLKPLAPGVAFLENMSP